MILLKLNDANKKEGFGSSPIKNNWRVSNLKKKMNCWIKCATVIKL